MTQRLVEALVRHPGQSARELAHELATHKSVLNPILYHDRRFSHSADSRPLWYLAGTPDATRMSSVSEVVSAPSSKEPTEARALVPFDELFTRDDDVIDVIELHRTKPRPPRTPDVDVVVDPHNPFGLYAWQRDALAAWRGADRRGIVDAVTGAGKTRLAVAAISEALDDARFVTVLVPTIQLLAQWYDVLHSFFPQRRIGRCGGGFDDNPAHVEILIAVMASARTRRFTSPERASLVVVDECHRVASEQNQYALESGHDWRMGLSATHERMDNAHTTILMPYFGQVIYQLNYRAAIDQGVITNVRVAFVGVEFSEEEKQLYAELSERLSTLRRTLIRECGVRPFPFSAFLDDVVRLVGSGPRREGMVAGTWLTAWRDRKNLLAETPAKQTSIGQMLGAFADAERTLLFTQSIESANVIAENLGALGVAAAVHHSGLDGAVRADVMERFERGSLTALASVQTLEEGVDVPDADLAIIVAASKQRRQMVQRMGRIMRRKRDGRDARFIIQFVQGTDEDPRLGAHESFLGDLLEVAREVEAFDLGQARERERFRRFLDPARRD